jgi:hypothetical protein
MAQRRRRQREPEPVATNASGSGGSALYRVTRVDDSTMLANAGGFQRSKKVYFTLADGTTSFIEIPLTSFTRDNVANAIDAHVGELLQVLNIQGPDMGQYPT